jgi:biopolymer transport protein ExbD
MIVFVAGRSRTIRRISLTPLIDIVFILLLFFILETNFLQLGEIGLNLPETESEGKARTPAIVLQLFADGNIWTQGKTLTLETLSVYLVQKELSGETPIVLAAADPVSVQTLVDVIDLLQEQTLHNLQVVRLEDL